MSTANIGAIQNILEKIMFNCDISSLNQLLAYLPAAVVSEYLEKFSISPLFFAIKNKNIEMVRKLLSIGMNPNRVHDTASTLMFAIKVGDIGIIRLLLQSNADPNLKVLDITPLAIAIEFLRHDIVDMLLMYSANPNLEYYGKFPICHAISKDSNLILSSLIRYGIDVNKRITKEGYTPIIFATIMGSVNCIEELLTNSLSKDVVNIEIKIDIKGNICNAYMIATMEFVTSEGESKIKYEKIVSLLFTESFNFPKLARLDAATAAERACFKVAPVVPAVVPAVVPEVAPLQKITRVSVKSNDCCCIC
jgi:hypothetical protein